MILTIEWYAVTDKLPPRFLFVLSDYAGRMVYWDGEHWRNKVNNTYDKVKYWARVPTIDSFTLSSECPQCVTLLGEIKQLRERLEFAEKNTLEQELMRQAEFSRWWESTWNKYVGELKD